MLHQRSALRHRSLPLSLRPRGFPTPLHKRFLTEPEWPVIWISASLLSLVVLGGILAAHCFEEMQWAGLSKVPVDGYRKPSYNSLKQSAFSIAFLLSAASSARL